MLTIDEKHAIAIVKVGPRTSEFIACLEGRKKFITGTKLRFEATEHNIGRYRELFPEAPVEDHRQELGCDPEAGFFDGVGHRPTVMKTQPWGQYQVEAYEKSILKNVFALFMEQGTGKTWVALKNILYRYFQGQIEGVIVATYKGVHEQWIHEQLHKHMPDDLEVSTWAWHKREAKQWGMPSQLSDRSCLSFFTINIDSVSTKLGYKLLSDYVKMHKGKILFIVDESHLIKNDRSIRTKKCYSLGGDCNYRMVLTGTPQSKTVIDQWAQYKFLDERIIGERYKTTFRNKYCVVIGEGAEARVVGTKNLDEFRRRVEPYTYRITKENALGLPPKIYERWHFDLAPKTRKHYDNLKQNFLTMLEDGTVASVDNAAVLVTRLQQLARGWLVEDETKNATKIGNEAIEALSECIAAHNDEKIAIWARFKADVREAKELLGDEAVVYAGGMSDAELAKAKKEFLDVNSGKRFFISNPSVGGAGLDGLQEVCSLSLYFSNSFNALDRWQSEDRTHRIGTPGDVKYIDLVARKTVDNKLLANLRQKKSMSELALGDIISIIEGGDGFELEAA